MPTEQIELTLEQNELIEKLNCLEFETSQLNHAYQLWRSYVEQGTVPDWMASGIGVTYDALITLCLEVSTILADVPHAFSAKHLAQLGAAFCEISGTSGEESTTAEPSPESLAMTDPDWSVQTELTVEQNELIEKLNCLEFETSQLNHAYQLWRSHVEQGTAPDWMAATISITYDVLITFCLNTAAALALNTSHADETECYARSSETAPLRPQVLFQPRPALTGGPGRGLLAEDSITALCFDDGQRLQCDDAETDPSVRSTGLVDGSLALTPVRQENQIVDVLTVAEGPRAFSARYPAESEAAACEISGILGEESTTAEPSPELLPMTEPDWSRSQMPVAISPPSTGDAISEQPAFQQGHEEEEVGEKPAAIHSLATLVNWLQGSSTGILFFIPPVVLGRLFRASVPILIVVGGTSGFYMATAHRGAARLAVQNSATQPAAGVVAIPTDAKAEFKFDPDPVVVPIGRSIVLNAVLSRGSD